MTNEAHFEVFEEVPAVDAYHRIRAAAGLAALDLQGARVGLHNSLYAICVHRDGDDGEVVAMGRVVGDGGTYFQVVDVAVVPECRGLGLTAMVLGPIHDWLADNAPAGARIGYDPCADGEDGSDPAVAAAGADGGLDDGLDDGAVAEV